MPVIFADDTDTAVSYSGVWNSLSSYSGYYNQTVHIANSTEDSKATIIFTGTTVRVYGVAVNTQSSYTIDGGNTTFPNATRSGPGPNYDILLYTSPVLLDGQHNLTIDANDLLIDYFLVTTPGDTSSSATLTSSVPSGDAQPTATNPMDSGKTTKSAHQKTIIGVVVALAIVAIFGVFCLWIRRRRKNLDNKSESWEVASSVNRQAVQWPVTYTPVPGTTPPGMVAQPLSPPSYPMSEPPPYDAGDADHWISAPVVRSQQPRSSVKLTRRGTQVTINHHGVPDTSN